MIRLTTFLALAFATAVVAAPVPPPSEKELLARHWGKFEGQGEFELKGKQLTLRTVGQPVLGLRFGAETMKMPRVTRPVRGDFVATVTVLNATPPNKDARYLYESPDSRAGLFLTGGGFELGLDLYQAYHRFNGVAQELQRSVWRHERSPNGRGGGTAVEDVPVGKSTYLRVTRQGKHATTSYGFDGKTWSEPRGPAEDQELLDEVTVGVFFGQSTYQSLSADFHAFTIEKLKTEPKKE
jgi:hypothetical protein